MFFSSAAVMPFAPVKTASLQYCLMFQSIRNVFYFGKCFVFRGRADGLPAAPRTANRESSSRALTVVSFLEKYPPPPSTTGWGLFPGPGLTEFIKKCKTRHRRNPENHQNKIPPLPSPPLLWRGWNFDGALSNEAISGFYKHFK